MTYRRDIQILRGIAVLLVVFFHLEVTGFSSGFLGVDIFFVISGYLMGQMYNPNDKVGFFAKRARRLLPAYFATVIVTLFIAVYVTTPNDYQQVKAQALFASSFTSNIGFWMENSYFDKAAFKPLLHLWSLGVEIQFYLMVPVLYWIFKRYKISLLLVLAISAFLCFLFLYISPKTSFFWLPFRLWEFLLGFGVSKYFVEKTLSEKNAPKWAGFAAMILTICLAFITVDGKSPDFLRGHPGLIALLITFTTATILAYGLPTRIENHLISQWLEKIGIYSYSIYLAHFPIIVLYLYQPFSGTNLKTENLTQLALLAGFIVGAAVLLYARVEKPFRASKGNFAWIVASMGVVFGVSALGTTIQNALIPEKELLIYDAWNDRDTYRCGKINRIINPSALSCEITERISKPAFKLLLVGNSHADSIKSSFATVAFAANVSVFFMVENNPLLKEGIGSKNLVLEAQRRGVKGIVLHYSPGSLDSVTINQLADLASAADIKLSFVLPVPIWKEYVPLSLLKTLKYGAQLPSQTIYDYRKDNNILLEVLNKIDKEKINTYSVADVFCRDSCLLTSDRGRPLYFDNGHLTLTGSDMLKNTFALILADLSH